LIIINGLRGLSYVFFVPLGIGLAISDGRTISSTLRIRTAVPPVHPPGWAGVGGGKASCFVGVLFVVRHFNCSYFDLVGTVLCLLLQNFVKKVE
jgi:hypothetical protein